MSLSLGRWPLSSSLPLCHPILTSGLRASFPEQQQPGAQGSRVLHVPLDCLAPKQRQTARRCVSASKSGTGTDDVTAWPWRCLSAPGALRSIPTDCHSARPPAGTGGKEAGQQVMAIRGRGRKPPCCACWGQGRLLPGGALLCCFLRRRKGSGMTFQMPRMRKNADPRWDDSLLWLCGPRAPGHSGPGVPDRQSWLFRAATPSGPEREGGFRFFCTSVSLGISRSEHRSKDLGHFRGLQQPSDRC